MISFKNTYLDFYGFLRNPVDQPAKDQTIKQKFSSLIFILAMEVPIMGIIVMSIYGINSIGLIDIEAHKVGIMFQQLPLWQFIFFGVVINPFMEELIFRFFLRFKATALTDYSLLSTFAAGKRIMKNIEVCLTRVWKKKFRLIFFSSALLFATFHLSNYELSITVVLLSPLLIAPQFIMGVFIGYLRIKYNLMLGYFMHSIHNAFFISLSLVIMKLF